MKHREEQAEHESKCPFIHIVIGGWDASPGEFPHMVRVTSVYAIPEYTP